MNQAAVTVLAIILPLALVLAAWGFEQWALGKWQFSVRSLLIAMTLMALALGAVVAILEEVSRRSRGIGW